MVETSEGVGNICKYSWLVCWTLKICWSIERQQMVNIEREKELLFSLDIGEIQVCTSNCLLSEQQCQKKCRSHQTESEMRVYQLKHLMQSLAVTASV